MLEALCKALAHCAKNAHTQRATQFLSSTQHYHTFSDSMEYSFYQAGGLTPPLHRSLGYVLTNFWVTQWAIRLSTIIQLWVRVANNLLL